MAAQENYQEMYYINLPPRSNFFKLLALRPTSVALAIQILAYRIQALPCLVVVLCVLGCGTLKSLLQQKEAHLLCGAKNLLLLQLKF